MQKQGLWRRTVLLLLFGLELPALVLLGLYLSWEVTAGWEDPWRSLAVLTSSLGFYAVGTLVIWWVALRIYRRQKKLT